VEVRKRGLIVGSVVLYRHDNGDYMQRGSARSCCVAVRRKDVSLDGA
jgi:hypothetical protein